jgi:MurNAc alpha-1-phosphate uridylyltransferase
MLSYALALCARHGLDEVIVNAHWLGEQLVSWQGEHESVRVRVSLERPDILGTGGGLRLVRHQLASRFAVVNGDILTDVDLTALLQAVPDGGGALALRVHPADALRYGIVAADGEGRISRMRDIAHAQARGSVATDTHFTGIHAMSRDALDLAEDGFSCIIRTAYKTLVPKRMVAGYRHGGTWLDVGDPKAYLQANLAVLDGSLSLPLDPFPKAAKGRPGQYWIGPDAVVEGELHRSIVGANAHVPTSARLDECVVWDGVEVPPGQHRRVIFAGSEEMAWVNIPPDSDTAP